MITISAKNFTLTEGIKEKVVNQFHRLENFISDNEQLSVVLDVDSNRHKAELILIKGNNVIKSVGKSSDLYKAIDLAILKFEKQIKRELSKSNNISKTSIRFIDYSIYEEEEEDNNEPKIVKRKFISSKPMYEKEAIAQMELLNHRSFIFFNADTNSICMIYKRHDGHYGIIETE